MSKLRQDAAYRQETQSCLIMGKQLIEELSLRYRPRLVIAEAPESIFKKITGVPHPEPFLAEFPLPPQSQLKEENSILVIDQIQDPGNLGTLLRTAIAFGWGGVFFLPQSVDPFNDKVIRASKGALFQLKYQMGSLQQLEALAADFTPCLADLEGIPLANLGSVHKPLLILSHERRGASAEMEHLQEKYHGKKVHIPMQHMESLNVAIAGSIIMYELSKSSRS